MGLLRLFLALNVLIEHANIFNDIKLVSYMLNGGHAVPVFFMISGFYMSLILNGSYKENRYGNLAFYVSRYLRLWPVYIVVLLLFVMFRPIHEIWDISAGAQIFVYFVACTMFGYELLQWFAFNRENSSLFFAETVKLGPGHTTLDMLIMMRPMWSIGIEIWFYIIAPFALRKFKVVFCLFCFAFFIHILLVNALPFQDPKVYRNALNYLYLFLAGSFGFYLYQYVITNHKPQRWILISCMVGMFLLLYNFRFLIYLIRNSSGLDLRYCQDIVYLPIAMFLPFVFMLSRHNTLDRFIGNLSYPLYVVHWPIVTYGKVIFKDDPIWWFYAISFSLLAAFLLEIGVSQPIDKLRHKLSKKMQQFTPKVYSG